jgi:hypothetical protein
MTCREEQALGASSGWKAAVAALLVSCALQAPAQGAAYKCVVHGTVTYSQVPCPGARPVAAAPRSHPTDKWKPPPQDRAVTARRSVLTREERQECRALDLQLARQERFVQSRGAAATLDDEMPLVQSKKRFRELRC